MKFWLTSEKMLEQDKTTCTGQNIYTHTNTPHPSSPHNLCCLLFQFGLECSHRFRMAQSAQQGRQGTQLLAQGTSVPVVRTPSIPSSSHWTHSALAGAVTTHSFPHWETCKKIYLNMTRTLCMWLELRLRGLTYSSAYPHSSSVFAESELTVHKDLDMISRSVTHGWQPATDCSACIANNSNPSTSIQTHFRGCSSQPCTENCRTGMARTRWVLKCFSSRHADIPREPSHCGDCLMLATSGAGAQQAHSVNDGEKELP